MDAWLEMMKKSSSFTTRFLVGNAAPVVIATRNDRRLAITISAIKVSDGIVSVAPETLTTVTAGHILFQRESGTAEFVLNYNIINMNLRDHGDQVRREWTAITSSLSGFVFVTEIIADSD